MKYINKLIILMLQVMESLFLYLSMTCCLVAVEAAPWGSYETTPQQQACGDKLADILSLVCSGRGYNNAFRPESKSHWGYFIRIWALRLLFVINNQIFVQNNMTSGLTENTLVIQIKLNLNTKINKSKYYYCWVVKVYEYLVFNNDKAQQRNWQQIYKKFKVLVTLMKLYIQRFIEILGFTLTLSKIYNYC